MNIIRLHQHTSITPTHFFIAFLLILHTLAPIPTAMAQKPLVVELSNNSFVIKKSGLIWQNERSDKIDSFMTMKNYVSQSEPHGWRLPTKQELHELVEIFDLHLNGAVKIDLEGPYWLTNDSGNEVTGAWEVGDQCGPSRTYYSHKRGYIRLVRFATSNPI